MQKRNKIILIALGVLVVVMIAIYSGNAELFQGRMFNSSKPLPSYDENKCYDSDGGKNYEEIGTTYGKLGRSAFGNKTDVCTTGTKVREYYCDGKFVQSEEYNCENGCSDGACEKTITNVSNSIDTLVIVDTDYYDISEQDVKDFFEVAENFWLKPKTGITFNLSKIVFVSLKEECPQFLGSCDEDTWMDQNFKYFDKVLPEYIVILTKDGGTSISGGLSNDIYYLWLDPEMESFYDPDSDHEFCTEFPVDYSDYTVPLGKVDYKHKFGKCGYDEAGTEIISVVSGNGECKGEEGLKCVMKNGYQMCPNLVDAFLAQDVLYLSAETMVHELLHLYGSNGNLDHFGTYVCNDAIGDILEMVDPVEPFQTLSEEYAGMCPNIWDNFKNSKKAC